MDSDTLAGDPGFVFCLRSSTCSQRESLWIGGTCFYRLDALLITQPIVWNSSKHWSQSEEVPTSIILSWSTNSSFYAGSHLVTTEQLVFFVISIPSITLMLLFANLFTEKTCLRLPFTCRLSYVPKDQVEEMCFDIISLFTLFTSCSSVNVFTFCGNV